jgi:LmbE family N-acetylglucosaminyl deacetylase
MTTTPQRDRQRTARLTVQDLGTTVGIWAHPDDETYLAGGVLAALRDAGQRVVCVTATRGDAGNGLDDGGTQEERSSLARTRTTELAGALGVLGVSEHRWLDYVDTGCSEVDVEQAVGRLLRILVEVRPDTVVGFGPDGFTGHPDHRAVARWTALAVDRCRPRPRLLQAVATPGDLDDGRDVDEQFDVFALGSPPAVDEGDLTVRLVLEGPDLRRKAEALLRQPSQTGDLVAAIGVQRFSRWVRAESFREA